MPLYIDAHAHLDDKKFDADRDQVIERAKLAGVQVVITNGLDPVSNRKALELAKRYPIVRAALGIYPETGIRMSPQEVDSEIEFIRKQRSRIAAVGEVGLDYHWIQGKDKEQEAVFRKLITLAEELNKTLIVHSRKAEVDVLSILRSSGLKKVMIHCFGGPLEIARDIESQGWSFSIPTSVVHNEHFQKLVRQVDIGKILTETDSPYLGPVPKERNEPANIPLAVRKIAEIKGLDPLETANIIFMNYQRLF